MKQFTLLRFENQAKPVYNERVSTFEVSYQTHDGAVKVTAVIQKGEPGSYWTPPVADEITDLSVEVGGFDVTDWLSLGAIRGFEDGVWEEIERAKREPREM